MPTKKKVASSTKTAVFRTIYFPDQSMIELLRKAATSRGWSFNAFVVRALHEAAQHVLASPGPTGIFHAPSMPKQPGADVETSRSDAA